MARRMVCTLLLVMLGCTGRRVSNGPSASLQPSRPRTRTALVMEVGPSVHPGSFRATGRLTDASGAPVAGATVRVTLAPLGSAGSPATFDLGTRMTDPNGEFQVTFHPPQKGTFIVRAEFAGDDGHLPSDDQGPVTAT